MPKIITVADQLARDSARERIRNYVEDQGFTKTHFASMIGMSTGAFTHYLSTDEALPARVYPRVAEIMGITKAELMRPLGPEDYKQEELDETDD